MARSALIVCGLIALLLGGCVGGPSRSSTLMEPAAGERSVAVPTRLSAGGRGSASDGLLILGVN